MKFLVILIITILCLSSHIDSAKIKGKRNLVLGSLVAFGIGFIQSFSGGNLKACLGGFGSEELQGDATSSGPMKSWLDYNDYFKVIVTIIRTATVIICAFRITEMTNFLKVITGLKGGRRRRVFNQRGIFGWVKKGFNHIKDHVVKKLRSAVQWLKEHIPGLGQVISIVDGFLKIAIAMFKTVKWIVLRVLKCGLAAFNIMVNFLNIWSAIALLLSATGTFGVTLVPYLPVFLQRIICDWERILNAFWYLKNVITARGPKAKSFQFGKFIGQLAVLFGAIFQAGGLKSTPIPKEPRYLVRAQEAVKHTREIGTVVNREWFLYGYKKDMMDGLIGDKKVKKVDKGPKEARKLTQFTKFHSDKGQYIKIGQKIKIAHLLTKYYLHSDGRKYQKGTKQQQMFGYWARDDLDWFLVRSTGRLGTLNGHLIPYDSSIILTHVHTKKNLYSNAKEKSPVTHQQLVSGKNYYETDTNNHWKVMMVAQVNERHNKWLTGDVFWLYHLNTSTVLHATYAKLNNGLQEISCYKNCSPYNNWTVTHKKN
jgi:hypothetical protein